MIISTKCYILYIDSACMCTVIYYALMHVVKKKVCKISMSTQELEHLLFVFHSWPKLNHRVNLM